MKLLDGGIADIQIAGHDANGAPIFEFQGKKFFFDQEVAASNEDLRVKVGDRIWKTHEPDRSELLIFSPDKSFVHHTDVKSFDISATN
jgi:hypothetical protein